MLVLYFFVISLGIFLFLLQKQGAIAFFILGFYLLLCLLFFIPGLLIWGRKDWKRLFGFSGVILGIFSFFASGSMYLLPRLNLPSVAAEMDPATRPDVFALMHLLFIVFGIACYVFLPLGLFLLFRDRKSGFLNLKKG